MQSEQREQAQQQVRSTSDWRARTLESWRRASAAALVAWHFGVRTSRRAYAALRRFAGDQRTHAFLRQLGSYAGLCWRKLGVRVARVAVVGGALLLTTIAIGRLGTQRVAPGVVGVRVSEWGGGGVTREDFAPGLHLSLPGLHAWHRLPSGTDWITWRAATDGDPGAMLGVRTQDGNEVFVAVAVPYHIRSGEAHEIVVESNRNTYRNIVSAKTETLLLAELGRLSSEQFTNTDARNAVLELALEKLNESLAEVHVEAEAILLEDVRFPAAYEKKLQENQLEKLRGRMLAASQAVAEEEQIIARKKLETEGELQGRRIELERAILLAKMGAEEELETLERETKRYVAEQRARADREFEALALEGKARVLEAEALEDQLTHRIYASEGGRLYLARLTAEATHIESVVLDAGDPRVPNVLDPDEMVRLFMGE